MMVTDTLNSRIALCKGLTYEGRPNWHSTVRAWFRPDGTYQGKVPDYVGTLAGVAELMRELNELRNQNDDRRFFWWRYNAYVEEYQCGCEHLEIIARSSRHRPGDCVGEAWLSMFGKKEMRDGA